ncbi:MAG: NAD(P)/FAD-dependent oxidoreductase [Clostridia bacterium]|nr:NAD(P)/FAD-dependent oxidoreductase [Clostridia bacterium]
MVKIGIIGAGAAGLIAGAIAAKEGAKVEIIDRNERAGRKLYLTGKGRCNITNAADRDEFLKNIPRNGRFLYSAFDAFFSDDILEILKSEGVPAKLERGGRYFPESDKSSDVIRALVSHASKCGARLLLGTYVQSIEHIAGEDGENGRFLLTMAGMHGGRREYDRLIIATGGLSYSSTGSTGDGYAFAERFGHTVVAPKPSLIPFETEEDWPCELMGLSLKNVTLRAYKAEKNAENSGKKAKKQKPVYEELGEMLFTHFGVSGPLVLSASSYLADSPEGARLEIDLKPGLTPEQLDARLLRDFEKYKHKQVNNAMVELLPSRLIDTVLMLARVEPSRTIDELTREERSSIAETLKCMTLTVKRARPIEEAIITRGGVSIKEIDPRTMESKLIPGLFFAGEVIDADACTGGFNLQIAWSTGAVAGSSSTRAY